MTVGGAARPLQLSLAVRSRGLAHWPSSLCAFGPFSFTQPLRGGGSIISRDPRKEADGRASDWEGGFSGAGEEPGLQPTRTDAFLFPLHLPGSSTVTSTLCSSHQYSQSALCIPLLC